MSARAIDIVLLPDPQTSRKAIEYNRLLVEQGNSQIVLSETGSIPHISLAMGIVEQDKTSHVSDVLKNIWKDHPPLSLTLTGVTVKGTEPANTVSSFSIKRSQPLQNLHETIIKDCHRFFTTRARPEHFVNQKASSNSVNWVNNYLTDSSFENFDPHITIGYGKIAGMDYHAPFTPTALTLCHLGDHCTCRQILFRANY